MPGKFCSQWHRMDPPPECRLPPFDQGLPAWGLLLSMEATRPAPSPCLSRPGSSYRLHQTEWWLCPVPELTCSVLAPATSQCKGTADWAQMEEVGRWQAGGRVPQGLSSVS